MIRLYYLILAHEAPKNLQRLVSALQDDKSLFYIHIDNKSDINIFIEHIKGKNIHFIENRVKCQWGHFNIVQATLNGLKEILLDHPKDEHAYIILLSGDHYPIKSNDYLYDFFNLHYGRSYIEAIKMPKADWLPNGGMNRVGHYHFFTDKRYKLYSFKNCKDSSVVSKISDNKVYMQIISNFKKYLENRIHPSYIDPYGGSQWWCLPIESIKIIFRFLEKNPDYVNFHQETFAPDEIFFHSILGTCEKKEDGLKIIKKKLTFEEWPSLSSPSPSILSLKHKYDLKSSNLLFARKINCNSNESLIEFIETNLRG